MCGSKTTTAKGKKLEDFLSQEGLCIFNDGTDTYLHPGNGSYSAIDLTFTDPSLLLDFSWKVHDELCGNDHFPIIMESLNSTVGERLRGINLTKLTGPCTNSCAGKNLQRRHQQSQKGRTTVRKTSYIGQSRQFPHLQGESLKNIETKSAHFLA